MEEKQNIRIKKCEFIMNNGEKCNNEMYGLSFECCHLHRDLHCVCCNTIAKKYCENCFNEYTPLCNNTYCENEHNNNANHFITYDFYYLNGRKKG